MKKSSYEPESEQTIQHVFDAYIKRIVKRKITNLIVQIIKHREYFDSVPYDDVGEYMTLSEEKYEITKIFKVGAEEIVLRDEDLIDILLTLRTSERNVLLLNVCANRSLKEITQELNLTYETVRTYKKRALREVRGKMECYG